MEFHYFGLEWNTLLNGRNNNCYVMFFNIQFWISSTPSQHAFSITFHRLAVSQLTILEFFAIWRTKHSLTTTCKNRMTRCLIFFHFRERCFCYPETNDSRNNPGRFPEGTKGGKTDNVWPAIKGSTRRYEEGREEWSKKVCTRARARAIIRHYVVKGFLAKVERDFCIPEDTFQRTIYSDLLIFYLQFPWSLRFFFVNVIPRIPSRRPLRVIPALVRSSPCLMNVNCTHA